MTTWRPSRSMCPSGPYFPASSLSSPLTLKLEHQLDGKHQAAAQPKPGTLSEFPLYLQHIFVMSDAEFWTQKYIERTTSAEPVHGLA